MWNSLIPLGRAAIQWLSAAYISSQVAEAVTPTVEQATGSPVKPVRADESDKPFIDRWGTYIIITAVSAATFYIVKTGFDWFIEKK